jgi:hypothetical protein
LGPHPDQEALAESVYSFGRITIAERDRFLISAKSDDGLTSVDEERLTVFLREVKEGVGASSTVTLAGGGGGGGGAGGKSASSTGLPRDNWAKKFLSFESRDFFEELRRGSSKDKSGGPSSKNGNKKKTRPQHDHDAEPVSLDFVDVPRRRASGALLEGLIEKNVGEDAFSGLALVLLSAWVLSLGLLLTCLLRFVGVDICSMCLCSRGKRKLRQQPMNSLLPLVASQSSLLSTSSAVAAAAAAAPPPSTWGQLSWENLKRASNPAKMI